MRTIVELPEQQIEALKILSEQEGLSRAELMRRAIAAYLRTHLNKNHDSAFALWKSQDENGLEYQQKLRKEWDE